ncbi:hypothetical protein GOP47_0026409 [Adiantum capillus-veneris]|nr:hypothetical protein GOP47_0026409 [Adiantum capillus-veneris]
MFSIMSFIKCKPMAALIQRSSRALQHSLAALRATRPSFDSSSSRQSPIFSSLGSICGAAAVIAAWQSQMLSDEAHSEAEKIEKTALRPNEWTSFKLGDTIKVSPNTNIYRFTFDDDEKLGLDVASCLITRAQIGNKDDGKPNYIIRPYTPISPPDSQGYFDLMVKVYPQGKMSRHIGSLKPGDTLEVKGPIAKIPYKPNMKKNIGMIAGGTGITPMLQVIDAILGNIDDLTKVYLIYANLSPEDILLKEKLDLLAAKNPNFKVYYVVDKPSSNWNGGSGYITKDMVLKGMPAPSEDTLILVCGPPGMMKHISGDKAPDKSQGEVSGLLKEAGYSKDMVYKF